MLKSYLIVVARILYREKFYAFICIASLSLGVACSLVISLYLYSELTYDHYHVKHDNIYKLSGVITDLEVGMTGYETGPLLQQDNPQILDYVRFISVPGGAFTTGENTTAWEESYFTDPSVFEMFTFDTVYGNKDTAFSDPYSIVVSKSFAQRHFGDENPIGKTVSTENQDLRVSLVFEDLPENTNFRYDVLLPMSLYFHPGTDDHTYLERLISSCTTYLLVTNDFEMQDFESMSARFFDNHMKTGFPIPGGVYQVKIKELDSLHFWEEGLADGNQGNISNIYTLVALNAFLLLIACVNYVNIATARASKRAKEVGIRKVLGARENQLALHFIGESSALALISVLLGVLLGICILELGVIDSIIGKSELLTVIYTPQFLIFVALLWAIVSIVSGLYPALYLSRASAMAGLRKTAISPGRKLSFRQLLVLFQLVVTSSIIVCVLVMGDQVKFLADSPLGFEKENRLVARLRGAELIEDIPLIRSELMSHSDIISITAASAAPGRGLNISIQNVESNESIEIVRPMHILDISDDYLRNFGIELLTGRGLPIFFAEDGLKPLLVNETFVREMQWEQPLGKRIAEGEIVGVFRDYHYLSLHEPIGALVLQTQATDLDYLTQAQRENVTRDLIIEVAAGNLETIRPYINEVVEKFRTGPALELLSLDESWARFYENDINLTRLIRVFAGISVVISLLGLVGLATFAAEQRRREIAIRKVLGASTGRVVQMLASSTSVLVAVAILPSSVVSYYAVNQWLSNFSYKIELSLAPFLYAFLAVGVISLAAVIMQSYSTASSNPAESLRYE